MPTGRPTPIPIPTSSFPGANPQEGAGRLINCYAEPLGNQGKGAIAPTVWRRAPGLSVFARTAYSGYRGGAIVLSTGLSYECWAGQAATVDALGNVTALGSFPGTQRVSIAHDQVFPNPDVVAVDLDNGAYILNTAALANASITATVAGTSFKNADMVTLQIENTLLPNFPVTLSYNVTTSDTPTTVATGLTAAINANTTLQANSVAATSAAAVITITQAGEVGNSSMWTAVVTGTGNETVTFNPTDGLMAGGTGTPGITFTGTPLPYTGLGNLPVPSSVAFCDGYFFYTIGDGRVFASVLNSLQVNGLTFITIESHADVLLLRAIEYSGLTFFLTTASCDIWQDVGNPAPAFPFNRMTVLEIGLLSATAIAGQENGFAQLLWAAQDYGVYYLPPQSIVPTKVSTPDVDRAIEQAFHAGDTLAAGCYLFEGHKFWHISSSSWTWEFNLNTQQWHERMSLLPSGIQGRWRGMDGHPAFRKFMMGDMQSGNLLWIDDQNFTDVGVPQLFRIESGPVAAFPAAQRLARADFLFDMGVGVTVGNFQMMVRGTAAAANGEVILTVMDTSQANSGDTAMVSGVGGTTEANGTWTIAVNDATHVQLTGSVYANAFTSGGTAVDITASPQASDPKCAVSVSLDGGLNFGNPLIRSLGKQGKAKRARASVKNMGLSSPMGNKWRLDVTDPVYTGFLMGTQSNDPREVGA